MRAFYLVFAAFVVAIGLLFIISPLTRDLGFTFGSLVGVVLVVAGSYRLARELRSPR